MIVALLTEVPCQTSSPDPPLQPASSESSIAQLFLSTFLFFLLVILCRLTQHVQKDFPFCIVSFVNLADNRFVDEHELYEVSVSLFAEERRCACDHFRPFFLTLKQLICQLFCEELVKRN